MSTDHLTAVTAIQKKLKGKSLTYEEIYAVMDEIAHERLGDVLTAYFAAAGFSNGFSDDELYHLTKAMVETGDRLTFPGIVADKHSTGGLAGTRTTPIIVPIVAAAGFCIPKASSRAITTPAGTADVMELFCKVTFTPQEISSIVEKTNGCIIWGGKLGIAPADDVLIRVEEPLSFESFDKIIVSIMAKKIAMGTNHLILDIPWGPSMKVIHKKDAQVIVSKFQAIADRFKIKTDIYLNHASEPAGFGIGAYLEAIDLMRVLEQSDDRPLELEKKALKLAGRLLDLCYHSENSQKNGLKEATEILRSGKALEKFQEIVHAQGGPAKITRDKLHTKALTIEVPHRQSGTIEAVDNRNLNAIAKVLGAPADRYAGIELHHRRGSVVTTKDIAFTMHSTKAYHLQEAEHTLTSFPVYHYS